MSGQNNAASQLEDKPAIVILKNDKVCLKFTTDGKPFLKEFSTKSGNILPENGSASHIWRISLLGPHGETPSITPNFSFYDGATLHKDTDTSYITAKWRLLLEGKSDWDVTVKVSLAKDSELPEWNLAINLPKDWIVTEVEFPSITFKSIKNQKAILPIGYGIETQIHERFGHESRYPSCTGAMQVMMVHDNAKTLYFSTKDKTGAGKWLAINEEFGNIRFSQRVTTSYAWSENGRFALPWPTVFGLNDGNWQETILKWYRPFATSTQWGSKTLKERKIVKWIEHSDLWLRPNGTSDKTVEALERALEYYGSGVGLHWYHWHNYEFDTHYPDYFPVRQGFAEMVKAAQRKHARITPYINGRLWDSATESYISDKGFEASCRKADGTLYTEVYASKVVNTVTCPSSAIWQNKLRDISRKILTEIGTDGVYFDQIAAAKDEPCYASNHPHPKGGGSWWPQSYRKMIEDFRENLFGAEKAITTEENAECYIDMFDMLLIVNTPHNPWQKMVPLFPLVYSDRCVYSGYTYLPWSLNDGSMRHITMMSLLWGAQLGWADPRAIMSEKNTVEAEFLKNLTVFRKENHDLFYGGRFFGEFIPSGENKKIVVPGYGESYELTGAEWLDTKGRKFAVIVNMGQTEAMVTVQGKKVTIKALNAKRIAL